MVTDLNNTGKRKRIYTKHKITTSETDNILLSEKGKHKKMKKYSDNDYPSLPPKVRPFNRQKRYTQVILTILNHLKFLRTMTP